MKGRSRTTPKPRKDHLYDGIKFDSNLEIYCYKKLKENRLMFEYHPKAYELVPAHKSEIDSYEPDKRIGSGLYIKQKKVFNIKYTPDFLGNGWLIETKGYARPDFDLKWKLFLKYIHDNRISITLFKPSNHLEVDQTIEIIKSYEINECYRSQNKATQPDLSEKPV